MNSYNWEKRGFNVAAAEQPRKAELLLDCFHVLKSASMWPRLNSRGKQSLGADGRPGPRASMWPRLNSRGKINVDEANVETLVASMWPRLNSRGKHSTMGSII